MPFSPMFDLHKTVYKEFSENKIDVIVCLSYQDECKDRAKVDLITKYGKDGYGVM